ncbi:MAG: ferrous iron transport protein A [Candidatus Omnitrophica bacterium]|nr:ferrous iron transport protein A [Candidatus Omnitrophota bacterium]
MLNTMTTNRLSLVKLKQNQKAKVLEILGGVGIKQRLLSLGIYPGREITKISHFALRGPITVKVGRTTLALGYGMAEKIIVEII